MVKRVGMVIQARMGSTRLPGKVLKPVGGRPVLEVLLRRLSRTRFCQRIVVATTMDEKDDPLVDLCRMMNVPVFRGSEEDVLSRYYLAAREHSIDVVVRITGDCPLADPVLIDEMVSQFMTLDKAGKVDYLSNTLERTYPRGLDVEIFTFKALEAAHKEAIELYQREHVTPFIWENPKRFKLVNVKAIRDDSALRLTVDTQEDLDLIVAINDILTKDGKDIVSVGLSDVLKVLKENPDLTMINAEIKQKSHKEFERKGRPKAKKAKGKKPVKGRGKGRKTR